MATKNPKIVLYSEDIADGKDFASATVKSANVIDALGVMQTDYEPEESDVQVNDEGKFLVANLTDSEAKKLAGTPGVDEVVDDIMVYAQEPATEEGNPFEDEAGLGSLELDQDDIEALEEDPFPEWDPEDHEDLLLTPEQAELMTQMDPGVTDDDIELENRLLDSTAEASADQLQPLGVSKPQLVKIIRCILKCALDQKNSVEELSDQEIEGALHSAGIEGEAGVLATDVILWNLRQIYAPQSWRYSTGAGVRVAVVDTGIYSRHPDLRVYGGVSYVPGRRSWQDDHYHGTHVAGTIAASYNRRGIVGVAPNVRLYAVKVLNRQGSGRLSWILNGLMWCRRARMHVVNLSLGSIAKTHNTRVYNPAYERVGRALRRSGILAVAAAGNSGRSRYPYVGDPARCPSFMAVSAIDRRRRRASFSSYGPQVEICAPGASILSTVPRSGYRALNGTSMACPHVAAVAALVKARRPAWHGDRIRVHLWRTSIDLGRPGRDWAFGYGQVNAYRAVR